MMWQPIETALKTGEKILLIEFDGDPNINPDKKIVWIEEGAWNARNKAWGRSKRGMTLNLKPTHWEPKEEANV
jgi:hypothetical protein